MKQSRLEKRLERKRTPASDLGGDDYAAPERELLSQVLCNENVVARLSRAPGGWRTLSRAELVALELPDLEASRVVALQELVSRGYPRLPPGRLASSADVGRVYGDRLGGLVHEMMLAVGLDGQNNFVGEVTLAIGGAHGLSVTARDILRPLIRMGASGGILLHNHPSGDPTPSREDIVMTMSISAAADIVGLALVDHVVVARGGRWTSMLDLGLYHPEELGR